MGIVKYYTLPLKKVSKNFIDDLYDNLYVYSNPTLKLSKRKIPRSIPSASYNSSALHARFDRFITVLDIKRRAIYTNHRYKFRYFRL